MRGIASPCAQELRVPYGKFFEERFEDELPALLNSSLNAIAGK